MVAIKWVGVALWLWFWHFNVAYGEFPIEAFSKYPQEIKKLSEVMQPGTTVIGTPEILPDGTVKVRASKKLDEATGYVMMRLEAQVDVPIIQAASVWFGNIEKKHLWTEFCKEMKLINPMKYEKLEDEMIEVNTATLFIGSELPVISPRSFVTEYHTVVNKKNRWIASLGAKMDNPAKIIDDAHILDESFDEFIKTSGQVVGEILLTSAYMKEAGSNKTDLDFTALVKPGGWIPAAIANFGASSWPTNTLTKLKEQLTEKEIKKFEMIDYFSEEWPKN